MNNINDSFESERLFLDKLDNTLQIKRKLRIDIVTGQGLAFTNQRQIAMGFEAIARESNDYREFVGLFKGLNYHELAHIFYTKYTTQELRVILEKEREKDDVGFTYSLTSLWKTLNILEDGRIELMFSKLYPRAIGHFLNTAYKLILKKGVVNSNNNNIINSLTQGLLIYGRRLLHKDSKLTQFAKDIFIRELGDSDAIKVMRLVDYYNATIDPQQQYKLAMELYKITQHNLNNPTTKHNMTAGRDKKNTKEEQDSQKKIQEETKKQLKQDVKNKEETKEEKQKNDKGLGTEEEQLKELIHSKSNKLTEQLEEDIEQSMVAMDKKDFENSDDTNTSTSGHYDRWHPKTKELIISLNSCLMVAPPTLSHFYHNR